MAVPLPDAGGQPLLVALSTCSLRVCSTLRQQTAGHLHSAVPALVDVLMASCRQPACLWNVRVASFSAKLLLFADDDDIAE